MTSSQHKLDLPDIIVVKKLEVRMIVGVDNWERVQAQTVTIDARVHTDVSKAGNSDHLPYSIHYGILVKQLEAHCASRRYRSLEALAEGLAKICIFVLHAPKVTLNVEKPRSLLHAASAGVQIVRTSFDYLYKHQPIPVDLDPIKHLDQLRLSPSSTLALQDKVIVRDLIINTIIGVNPWERQDKQDVKLNLVIYSGLGRAKQAQHNTAGLVDVVNKQHNYRTIVRSISAYVEASSHKTVESLATSIARVAVLHNKVEKVRVSVDKPSAIMFASSAGVEVERTRHFFEQEALQEEQQLRAHHFASAASEIGVVPLSPPLSASIVDQSESSHIAFEQGWHVAAIALGSNLGDRAANIEAAVQCLSQAHDCLLVDTSFLYETAPMYLVDQPNFLNAACRIATKLSPHDLLALTQSIELKLGRDKAGVPDKGPRCVDLDILLYDNLEINDAPRLMVPHPGIKEREFVLEPLKDILPDFEHPTYSRTMSQLLIMLQKSPDYEPSGIKKVLAIPSPTTRSSNIKDTKTWTWGSKTFIMGIINATPDSFSDGGDNLMAANALRSATAMAAQGADVIDVGGMSTAPNAVEVSADQEEFRVVSVIRAIREAGITIPISVDTFRASVAEAALAAGADMINDVSGGERDPAILEVAKQAKCPYILMHMRGDSKTMNGLITYEGGDVVAGVRAELEQRLDRALRAGVRRWNIVLDPGIGFAKDSQGNLSLLRDLARLTQPESVAKSSKGRGLAYSGAVTPALDRSIVASFASTGLSHVKSDGEAIRDSITRPCCSLVSFPTLIGVSRKKFLGHITGKQDPKQRVYATAAACTAAIAAGADILRVHDVEQIRDVAITSDAIYR
ncbi:related to multifunctional folic acid synthesis protein [Melanopsichium pennsylvanicum]|uniref:Related to multifunctional folic acid synthesis protein n=2 Tax=Melanopsichium pennsylvanicum TaxID=63383 RepID=A0AAJ5C5H1_9BASI|nr:related to multifunctional folic acid synthesis protein [Melanopsichium pennsylvanicum 4]SNX84735.1 related to multifunctional folic acid synthesis protein [Melanopsichium pennsylvanicum]